MNEYIKPPFISTGFSDNENCIKNRFSNILKCSKKKQGTLIFSLLIILVMLLGTLVSCTVKPTDIDITNTEVSVSKEEKTVDEAISKYLLSYNSGKYYDGECIAEGHKILGTEEINGKIKVYAVTMYGEYGFQNNNFIKVSGTGAIPAVIIVSENGGVYKCESIEYPIDGSYYEKSIKEMFPVKYQKDAFDSQKHADELNNMERIYAENYLKSIERVAEIGEYGDFEHLLPDMNTDCSNALSNTFSEYPYWIGNEEKIENGVRTIYSKDWESSGNGDGTVIFKKTDYETKKIIAETVIEIKDGKLIYIKGKPEKENK